MAMLSASMRACRISSSVNFFVDFGVDDSAVSFETLGLKLDATDTAMVAVFIFLFSLHLKRRSSSTVSMFSSSLESLSATRSMILLAKAALVSRNVAPVCARTSFIPSTVHELRCGEDDDVDVAAAAEEEEEEEEEEKAT